MDGKLVREHAIRFGGVLALTYLLMPRALCEAFHELPTRCSPMIPLANLDLFLYFFGGSALDLVMVLIVSVLSYSGALHLAKTKALSRMAENGALRFLVAFAIIWLIFVAAAYTVQSAFPFATQSVLIVE